MFPDFDKADKTISDAAGSGRWFLHEHEIYDLLKAIGIGDPPKYALLKSLETLPPDLDKIPGDRLVLKITHPRIAHKSDVGGVKVVKRENLGEAAAAILVQSPIRQAELFLAKNEVPDDLKGLSREELGIRLAKESEGVLVSEFIEAPAGFGNELFLGMRATREFGPIINCGLGGLDTELYAREISPGRSGVTISPGLSDEAEFFQEFKGSVGFETLTGIARGHAKLVEPARIADLLERFHALVWRFSPLNPDAKFWFTECEINPFLVRDGALVPVDGLLRFKPAEERLPSPPSEKIGNLLKPRNICIIGVSSKGMNFARVILRNLLQGGFKPDTLAIVKDGESEIDGVKCYPSIADLPGKFDLLVLSVAATQVPDMVSQTVESAKAESIILITGGMGEKEGAEDIEKHLRDVIIHSRARPDRGPVMVGGNSLGVISRPGNYDTMFVPDTKLPKNPDVPLGNKIALLSQSGAFMISRMSKLGGLLPRYTVSTGNQVDLGIGDFLEHLMADNEVRVFGCYVEGFKDFEGLEFAETARRLTESGRDVIVYKAGRSAEGRKAASGHTAAIAGDWASADAVLTRAGCIVARSFMEWANLIMLAASLTGRTVGAGRLAAISNAGYETVGMADNLRSSHYRFELAPMSDETRKNLEAVLAQFKLTGLVNVRNPLDLTPMAVDRAHVEAMKVFARDPNVDVILHACVPLSPMMKTRAPGGPDGEGIADPEGFTRLMIDAFRDEINKPLVVVIDSGSLYDPMAGMFIDAGIPVFRSADEAIQVFGRWVESKRKM
jgi:acyl-CoA synthetase (NDP forming)